MRGLRSPIALDTDIGSDVDDLLALAVILGSPELDLTAVTTVYGDVVLRARIVSAALSAAGLVGVQIAAGTSEPRSGRKVWWAGHEGSTIAGLDAIRVDLDLDALGLLASTERVVSIGPLTNIAAALENPDSRVREVVMMGAAFDERTEHNIRSDVDAAAVVFGAGVPITTIGIEMTERLRFTEAELGELPGALGAMISAEVRRYWSFSQQQGNTPHDAAAVLMLTSPELFDFAIGSITVESTGLTRFTPDPNGRHRIVTDLDVDGVTHQLVRRIRRACE